MSAYDEQPWLALYDANVPSTLELPFPNCVAMFDAAVQADAEAPLVHYFDATMSMGDVDRMSAALAVGLAQDCGVRRGDRVAVQLQNVPAFLLAMLAIWRLGAIMVPVNPMYKQELTGLLGDSGAKVLIQHESLYPSVGAQAAKATAVEHVLTTSELDFVTDAGASVFANSSRQRHDGTRDLLNCCRAMTENAPTTSNWLRTTSRSSSTRPGRPGRRRAR